MDILYESLRAEHVDAAVGLVMSLYNEEKVSVPFLPDGQAFIDSLRENIGSLFENGTGLAAIYEGELIGFISGFRVRELFGKCGGVYIPLYGHGVRKDLRSRVYQELYQRAADLWVKDSRFTHAITMFAHDSEAVDTWFWQGFGMRCVDAIREVSAVETNQSDIIIKKADEFDIHRISEIHRKHLKYYKQSPIFMLKPEEDPVGDLTEFMRGNNHHLWVAYRNERPLGYMSIKPNAESFVAEHGDIMNITGAYVLDEERKSGVGRLLLGTIQEWLLDNGYPLCGVDFEAINTTGSSFWRRYFTPYTYSLVRRIDERVRG